MKYLANAMRAQALRALNANIATARLGTVDGYDPNRHSVKVKLQPEGATTGWLPLLTPWAGNEYGCFIAPLLGDQMMVVFQEGDVDAGVAIGMLHSDVDRPLVVQGGECWLVHKTGSLVKLTNDGKATVSDKAGTTIVLNGDGTATLTATGGLTVDANVQVNGNLTASGNLADVNGAHGTLAALRTDYDAHTHTVPNVLNGTGTATTSAPSPTI